MSVPAYQLTPCLPYPLVGLLLLLSRFSRVRLFATPWAVARLASLSMGLSMQEHWSGLPCPSPEDLPDPGIEPMSFISTCIGKWVLYQ